MRHARPDVLAPCALALGLGLAAALARGGDEPSLVPYPHCDAIDDDDVAALEVLYGRVVGVSEAPLCDGQDPIVIVALRVDGEAATAAPRAIYLAPRAFLRENELTPGPGDELTVLAVGSSRTDAVTALQLERGKRALFLRDAHGHRLWQERPRPGA